MHIIHCLLEPGEWENHGDNWADREAVRLLPSLFVGGFIKWLILLGKILKSKCENHQNIYMVWLNVIILESNEVVPNKELAIYRKMLIAELFI